MPQVTLVFGNEVERIITDGDPVYHTAFIRQLQTHDDTPNPTIILPPFIQENIFDLLREHLVHNTYMYETVGFGKFRYLTYAQLYSQQMGYIFWCQRQNNPWGPMIQLIEWVDNPRTWILRRNEILPVARYFQVDQCSSCGVISNDEEHLAACNRNEEEEAAQEVAEDPDNEEESADESMAAPAEAAALSQHKVLQQWEAQGGNIVGLLGATPTEMAVMSSIRTAVQEENHREYLSQIGRDLQQVNDAILRQFKDGAYMIELKRAYARGAFVHHD